MKQIYNSRWFKFVLRTLFDWIVLALILYIALWFIIPGCSYDRREAERYEMESLRYEMDITEMRTYIDKKYNAKIFYPAVFHAEDTCGTGTAHFRYFSSIFEVSLKLAVDTNIVYRNVEEAVTRRLNNSDSTTICLDRGKDYYLIEDKGKFNSFLCKSFLIDNHWIGYTLYYDNKCEEIIGRLINLMKEWDPRKECKR